MTETLNPFKIKLENIKDAYRIRSKSGPGSQSRILEHPEIRTTALPKPSKEEIQRKIQKALLMKEHSG